MRLFLAIELPKEIKDYLFDLQKNVKEAKVTWVSKKNIHLTLKFFGDVPEKHLTSIKERINIKYPKINAEIGQLGFFPTKHNPRVIWVGIEPEEAIIKLQQKIDQEFLTDFPSDQQFRAHVTLGRVKFIRRREDFLKSIDAIQIENKPFVIDSFLLMKSELTKTGPIYEELERIALS